MSHSRVPDTAETARLEAFSDGVFAVAITLLALNLGVPQARDLRAGHGLVEALLDQWPIYIAYALSFVTILIMWINHHNLFRYIRRADHLFLLLNGLLLMVVTSIPFATNLLATYLLQPDKRVAQVVYCGVSLLMACIYNVMWSYASRKKRLLDADADARAISNITKQYRYGPVIYLAALLLAFASAEASLGLVILLAVFFALPASFTSVFGIRAGNQ